jgi:hypothetical protein
MSTERYVVKLANGEWVHPHGGRTDKLSKAWKGDRYDAYNTACCSGGVALRLKPSPRAAERKLDAMTKERDEMRARAETACREVGEACTTMLAAIRERDALAAQLATLPPDVSDAELAKALVEADEARRRDGLGGAWELRAAREARRLLRGPAAPARPVEELRDELRKAWRGEDCDWDALARRARELGAR